MGTVIGELLPLAVAVAISPIPVIAVILMLLAPEATATGAGFCVGWVAGIVAATVLFTVLTAVLDLGGAGGSSTVVAWVKLALGVLLLALSVRQWRSRPGPGEEPVTPGWMRAVDRFTPPKAFGLGFALAAVNPKNLAMCVSAGATIGTASSTAGASAVAVAVFTLVAAATVAGPVLGYAVAADRLRGALDRLKVWLSANNAAVMSVLLLVIGAVLLGKGIGGLA
ncbi:Sap-like sulfolipid-1-addressing protein [Stackebrandtia albiflava]|uniref:Sap-like sulfolipid-1-addressing protein n=1 Tax=Stackebrandtia albiflava TaxID=406432 RepID=A0A562V474_9ACTN|nr:GAP family protein [Stackebrandtia albiflava]TWJ12680.1 Sap-like sulfolipid-1-addressing protein [Stackebrandtia albiflava]